MTHRILRAAVVSCLLLCSVPAWAQIPPRLKQGTITVNGQTVDAQMLEVVSATITISGTWTGTITFYVSPDGGACDDAVTVSTLAGVAVSSATANGVWTLSNQGYQAVCATATASITGTATVTLTRGYAGSGSGASGGATDVSALALDASVNGLEDGVGASTDAAATQGSTGSISAKLRTLTAQLNTQAGYLDGLETLIGTTNSTLSTISSAIATINTNIAAGVAANLSVPIVSDGSNNDDETEIKGTAGVLAWIEGFNTDSTGVWVRCVNKTAANTTPGSETLFAEGYLPAGGGFVHIGIEKAFNVALACYQVTGDAVSDTTDPAANKVHSWIGYR